MPDLQFVLPHWLYWSALLGFPLIAMLLVRRQRRSPSKQAVNLPIGYLLLVSAGFVGFHRFYVGSWKGVFTIPLFNFEIPLVGGVVLKNIKSESFMD